MGWEQYLSAETLYNTTSSELEQIKNDLKREMDRRIERFNEYKKWIKQEFEQIFIWYQRHYNQQIRLENVEKELNLK